MEDERYNRIIKHPVFTGIMKELETLEQDRIFCGHGPEHLLAVARIGYIDILENHREIEKDVMYAAALLHDFGRASQYKGEGDHHDLGTGPARVILKDCGYEEGEIREICRAIAEHGREDGEGVLSRILYRADKKSRNCFCCAAYAECDWNENKKNRGIV